MPVKFEWNRRRAQKNLQKHRVDFTEASTVFADTLSITIPDPDHSEDEERWVTMGLSNRQRLLVVVHTEKEETIRIISARTADRLERRNMKKEIRKAGEMRNHYDFSGGFVASTLVVIPRGPM